MIFVFPTVIDFDLHVRGNHQRKRMVAITWRTTTRANWTQLALVLFNFRVEMSNHWSPNETRSIKDIIQEEINGGPKRTGGDVIHKFPGKSVPQLSSKLRHARGAAKKSGLFGNPKQNEKQNENGKRNSFSFSSLSFSHLQTQTFTNTSTKVLKKMMMMMRGRTFLETTWTRRQEECCWEG